MGTICTQPRQEEPAHRQSVAFRQAYKNVEFENVNGDISNQVVDAIVNPSNNQLVHNNGLSSGLIAKGGEEIQEECNKIMDQTDGILDIGTAVVTTAGKLQSRHIIHVVSPIWNGGENGEEEQLGQAVHNALEKADFYKITTIAVPCLSGGSFGFPREKCATIMVKFCLQYLDEHPETKLTLIRFVNMDNATVKAFKVELEKFMRNEMVAPNKSFHSQKSFGKNTEQPSIPELQKPVEQENLKTDVPEPVQAQEVHEVHEVVVEGGDDVEAVQNEQPVIAEPEEVPEGGAQEVPSAGVQEEGEAQAAH